MVLGPFGVYGAEATAAGAGATLALDLTLARGSWRVAGTDKAWSNASLNPKS